MQDEIQKILWLLWLQGYDRAPDLVKKCIESWRRHHPDWQIRVLDDKTVADYLDLRALRLERHRQVSRAAFSDIIRVNLLNQYGGVWIDATCYCQVPLESWLGLYMKSGFFAFRSIDPSQPMSSWFMASHPNSYIASRLSAATNNYWSTSAFVNPDRLLIRKVLSKLIKRHPKLLRLWFSPLLTQRLRIHPYFWLTYLFYKLCEEDRKFAEMWAITPEQSGRPIGRVKRASLEKPIDSELKHEIDSRDRPFYKLDWRFEKKGYTEASALGYLLTR